MVAGLGFGDEGKGSITDFLARQARQPVTVVRYNGGAQAGHNVVTSDGRHHTFAQFGSGTFVPGCRTHLSRFMLVNPIFLMREEAHLRAEGVTDAYERMTIERTALVTNPFQVASNRLKEMVRATGEGRHGSCGMGIGETMADFASHPEDALRIEDIGNPVELRRKLDASQGQKHDELSHISSSSMTPAMSHEWEILTDTKLVEACVERYKTFSKLVRFVDDTYLPSILREPRDAIFEGAQGVLLDQDFGFFPFVTRSDTTFGNALKLLDGFDGSVTKMGILRAYATRHGPGPFPTEDTSLNLPDVHNGYGPWQREFRFGHLDMVLVRYALAAIGGVDQIVMTNLDRLRGRRAKLCTGYIDDGLLRHLTHDIQNGIVEALSPRSGQKMEDLIKRVSFMADLSAAKPAYEDIHDLDVLLNKVESLGTPITLCSFGPTAEDKKPRC